MRCREMLPVSEVGVYLKRVAQHFYLNAWMGFYTGVAGVNT